MWYEHWYYFAGGLGLIIAGIIAFVKLRPETTKILVESAKVTVEMSDSLRDDLGRQVKTLTERVGQLESRLDTADERARRAERRATQAEQKVGRLTRLVHSLRDVVVNAHIDIPADLAAELDKHLG